MYKREEKRKAHKLTHAHSRVKVAMIHTEQENNALLNNFLVVFTCIDKGISFQ